jgi:hypothetical protein
LFTAVVRVTGAGRLGGFGERLRWLMVRDADAEEYIEHHGEGVLEYRFAPKKGIPFPAFAAASSEFPELRVEAEWEHDGVRGRAVIENGRLVEQTPGLAGDALVDVAAGEDGRLLLGFTCKRQNATLIGYAVTSDRHTYFRFENGVLTLVKPEEPDEALEEVAWPFVEEWLWYDEEEAPLERTRYAHYGYRVRGANLQSEKLALLRRSQLRISNLDAAAAGAREAIVAQWLNPA